MEEKFKALTIPPRVPCEQIFWSSCSPGPMTLVSNFYSDLSCPESENPSFSQLLAGAMASPLAKTNTLLPENSFKEEKFEDGVEKTLGFKKNRPLSLMVAANSPFFAGPTCFSPSGLLNSPGFFSPLQSPFGMSHQQALAHVTAQAALSQSYVQAQAEHHELPQVSQSEDKPSFNSVDRPASDAYNWRKYGQKMLKASECPRSYYKCTHLKCPVKKKVERSVDGHITDITYKGQHNHEIPQPSKRRRDGCAQDGLVSDCSKDEPEIEKHSGMEINGLNEALPARSEQVSTEMVASELPVSKESDEIEDSARPTGEGRNDEPNVKRMKTTTGETPVLASSHKTVSNSKIVVQTRSEVDILDDGFKWRKYGQKVVKGNHHPRSYYRCTYPGCNVRKHVERASADPKSVITTYEGKHNHDIAIIPRNRSHTTTPQEEIATRTPSLHEKVASQNKNEIPVCLELKEEQIAA